MWNADALQLDTRPAPAEAGNRVTLALIDPRVLDRECLARGLQASQPHLDIRSFGSVDEWRQMAREHPPVSAVLLSLGGQRPDEANADVALASLTLHFPGIPTIVLADSESASHVLMALDRGARGYIPTSVGLEMAIEIVNLARAGGIFVPASCLVSSRDEIMAPEPGEEVPNPLVALLTPRQAAVAEAMRQGKANKIIAYELDLRESTVKVHIRNIMRKLGAHNRTEVAFKLNNLMQDAGGRRRLPPRGAPASSEPARPLDGNGFASGALPPAASA